MDKEFEANFNIFLTFHRETIQEANFLLSNDKKTILTTDIINKPF